MKTAMVLTLVAWFSIPARANTTRDVRHDLDQYMQRITARGFSGAILVAKDVRVILSKGYGRLGPRGGSVTADTVCDLASVTKQLTATAILKLEMQGKLTTTDRISKYLASVPKDKERITIHHLLTHTAGVPDDVGGDYAVAPRDDTVQKILAAPLESVPGDKYSYSNAGYSLLAALVEKISGVSWGEFANQYLFQPAHMRDTGFLSRSGPPSVSSFTVVPVGAHEFSYFDFRSGKNIAINFSSTADRHVSKMVLHLPNAEMQLPMVGE